MSEQDVFDHVLASLHSAALDDAHWPQTSGLIDEACGSKGNMLVFGDGDSREDAEIFFARFCYRGQRHQESERKYFSIFHAVDERLPRAEAVARMTSWSLRFPLHRGGDEDLRGV